MYGVYEYKAGLMAGLTLLGTIVPVPVDLARSTLL
jgi:hypothetical protein